MTGTAILCSGQGSQNAGMFDHLGGEPSAGPIFDIAKSVFGNVDVRDLVRGASVEALHENRLGQFLCCVQTLAAWAIIKPGSPEKVVVAGYSVGELGAWGVAGLLDTESVFDLVLKRAAAMDAATTEPSGLMSVRGLTRKQLDPLCSHFGVYLAIINSSDQYIIGGPLRSLKSFAPAARAAGAARTALLPVSVASHTPLLATAGASFRVALSHSHLAARLPPLVRLLSGIDGAPVFEINTGADKLARQIATTVDWAACIDACRDANVTKFIELGPGDALARMIRAAIPSAEARSISEFATVAGFRTWAGLSR